MNGIMMDKSTSADFDILWKRIQSELDDYDVQWRKSVELMKQVGAVQARERGSV